MLPPRSAVAFVASAMSVTADAVAEPLHAASHEPWQEPEHFTFGAVTEHVPLQVPLHVPSAWMPVPVPPPPEASHEPSHLPVHSTPPCAVHEPLQLPLHEPVH